MLRLQHLISRQVAWRMQKFRNGSVKVFSIQTRCASVQGLQAAFLTFCAVCILTASVKLPGRTLCIHLRTWSTLQPWWPTFRTLDVLVYGSFANCVYEPVQNCSMMLNGYTIRMWQESVTGCFKVQPQYCSGETEKKHEKCLRGTGLQVEIMNKCLPCVIQGYQ